MVFCVYKELFITVWDNIISARETPEQLLFMTLFTTYPTRCCGFPQLTLVLHGNRPGTLRREPRAWSPAPGALRLGAVQALAILKFLATR